MESYYNQKDYYSEESYLDAFGGKVESFVPDISIFGSFEIKLSRPIVFPKTLVEEYIPGY